MHQLESLVGDSSHSLNLKFTVLLSQSLPIIQQTLIVVGLGKQQKDEPRAQHKTISHLYKPLKCGVIRTNLGSGMY